MKKNRIAVVVFSYYPLDVRVRREAEALAENGMDVDVIALRGDVESRKEKIDGVNVYRINITRKRGTKLRYLLEYGSFIVLAFIYLMFLQFIRHYKIIHVHNLPDILVLSALFPKSTGSRIILDLHDLMPEFYMRKYNISETDIIIKIIKYSEKLSAKIANHVITASPFFRKTLIKRSLKPKKCTIIMNLPDPKCFNDSREETRIENDKFRIIYPGTLGEIHGVDIAIKAIKRAVKKENIPIELHIYSRGAEVEKTKLVTLTKKLGLEDIVYFNSNVHSEKLAVIFKSMDVGLVPKRNGIHAQDAMSTKLFEYAAVGLPAIVSRTKSDSLYFDESMVMFFEPGKAKDLARCILELYRNPDKAKQLVRNAYRIYEKIKWDKTQKVYLRIVYDLTGNFRETSQRTLS